MECERLKLTPLCGAAKMGELTVVRSGARFWQLEGGALVLGAWQIVLAVALPACLRRRLPGLVLTTAVSLLCLAAIFGVVLAEWLSEARDLGSPWHNVRRGVDCATDEPMLTIRAATAFMFT